MNQINKIPDRTIITPIAIRPSGKKIRFLYVESAFPSGHKAVLLLQAPNWEPLGFWSDPDVIGPAVAKHGYIPLVGCSSFMFGERKEKIKELEKKLF